MMSTYEDNRIYQRFLNIVRRLLDIKQDIPYWYSISYDKNATTYITDAVSYITAAIETDIYIYRSEQDV